MTYELECGHCGCGFALPGPLARAVKCPVCGGMLTVAVAVPKPPPAPAPAAAPLPVPKLHFPPVRPEPGEPAPGRKLAPPWPTVRTWLSAVRIAIEFARPLYGLVLGFGLLSLPFQPAAWQAAAVGQLLGMLATVLFIPAALHACCQIACLDVPKGFGAWLVVASVAALGLAVTALVAALAAKGVPSSVTGVMGVGFALLAFGLWLLFLARLGARLGDADLSGTVTAFGPQMSGGFALAFPLFCCAYLAGQSGAWFVVWCGFAGGGAVGFLLLRRYAALLRTAALALERRAPAAP